MSLFGMKPPNTPSVNDIYREMQKVLGYVPNSNTILGGTDPLNSKLWSDRLAKDMLNSHTHQITNTAMKVDPMELFKRLLAGRMRWAEGKRHPFEFLDIHVTDKVALVFIVNDSKPVTLEDDPALFPSDDLITRLRLLQG